MSLSAPKSKVLNKTDWNSWHGMNRYRVGTEESFSTLESFYMHIVPNGFLWIWWDLNTGIYHEHDESYNVLPSSLSRKKELIQAAGGLGANSFNCQPGFEDCLDSSGLPFSKPQPLPKGLYPIIDQLRDVAVWPTCVKLGQLWRSPPSSKLSIGLAEASIQTASQHYSVMCWNQLVPSHRADVSIKLFSTSYPLILSG